MITLSPERTYTLFMDLEQERNYIKSYRLADRGAPRIARGVFFVFGKEFWENGIIVIFHTAVSIR